MITKVDAREAKDSLSDSGQTRTKMSDRDVDSTIQTVVDPSVIERTEELLQAGTRDRLQRWCSSLQPRFACGEQQSSTDASWVFRGTDLVSGTAVAVKILKASLPGSRNAFIAEALLLSELEHPGIVRYVAQDLDSGSRL